MEQKPSTITSLTPVRGVAALMVAVYHFDSVIANFVNQNRTLVISKCYLMVDLFFIMSGFIMLHVYGSKFTASISKPDFFKFIGARFARVYPLHFFTLLLWVAIFYGLHQPESPVNNPYAIPTHLLLLHSFGIHSIFTWNVPSWSISAEWWAYMLFPALAFCLNKFKNYSVFLFSFCSFCLYLSIMYYLPRVNPFVPSLPVPNDLNVTYDYGYIRGIAGFLAGMVIYKCFEKKEVAKFFANDFMALLSLLVTVLLFHFGANDLFIILGFMLVVLTFATNNGFILRLLKVRPLQYIGDISYSIYLTHGLAMFYLAVPLLSKLGFIYKGPGSLRIALTTGLWTCSVYLMGILLISSITYYLIEKPCRQWINQRIRKY